MALLPPAPDAAATAALARRLRGEGWLRPDVAGRVAFGLPADPAQQVDAHPPGAAPGRHGLRPLPASRPSLPPSAALAAAFSAATYPYRP